VKEFLSARGVPFIDRNVAGDPAAQQDLMQLMSRSGVPPSKIGVPVTVVDGEVIIGFDQARLERVLAGQAGRTGQAGKRPSFGARIADASRIAMKQGAVPIFGAYIGGVAPGSPAERAGIKPGDIITEINLRPINNADDMEKALAGVGPGGRVAVVYTRGAQKLRSEVSL
jgi:membrane-associated protease RseP (regulator of RpoE activity)